MAQQNADIHAMATELTVGRLKIAELQKELDKAHALFTGFRLCFFPVEGKHAEEGAEGARQGASGAFMTHSSVFSFSFAGGHLEEDAEGEVDLGLSRPHLPLSCIKPSLVRQCHPFFYSCVPAPLRCNYPSVRWPSEEHWWPAPALLSSLIELRPHASRSSIFCNNLREA